MKLSTPYWAEQPAGRDGANGFLESDIGRVVILICGAVAVIIIVICIFRMINSFTRGKPGEGIRIIIYGLLLGGLLINLNLTLNALSMASNIVENIFTSVGSITHADNAGQ